jgi:hypothetical protein
LMRDMAFSLPDRPDSGRSPAFGPVRHRSGIENSREKFVARRG